MVLNAAYLIPEETLEEFKIEAQRLDHKVQGNGFYLEYSGPGRLIIHHPVNLWPNYE